MSDNKSRRTVTFEDLIKKTKIYYEKDSEIQEWFMRLPIMYDIKKYEFSIKILADPFSSSNVKKTLEYVYGNKTSLSDASDFTEYHDGIVEMYQWTTRCKFSQIDIPALIGDSDEPDSAVESFSKNFKRREEIEEHAQRMLMVALLTYIRSGWTPSSDTMEITYFEGPKEVLQKSPGIFTGNDKVRSAHIFSENLNLFDIDDYFCTDYFLEPKVTLIDQLDDCNVKKSDANQQVKLLLLYEKNPS